MEIVNEVVRVTTIGSAGSAAGSAKSQALHGFLLDVHVNYHASAPVTSDLTVTPEVGAAILTVSNSATDALYSPRAATCDASAAATGGESLIPLNGQLTVALAQSDALTDAAVVTIRYMR